MTAEKDQKKAAFKCFESVGLDPDAYRIGHTKARYCKCFLFDFCCFTETPSFNLCSTSSMSANIIQLFLYFLWYWFWRTNHPSRILENDIPNMIPHNFTTIFDRHIRFGVKQFYIPFHSPTVRNHSTITYCFLLIRFVRCFVSFFSCDCPHFFSLMSWKPHSFAAKKKKQIQNEFLHFVAAKKNWFCSNFKNPWTFSLFLHPMLL